MTVDKTTQTAVIPRGRLRRFIVEHAGQFAEVKALNDGSKAMNIICDILEDPYFNQQQIADKYGVGPQYISQLMRDVECFGTPLEYAQAKRAGRAVTRSRNHGLSEGSIAERRKLTPRQLSDVKAIIDDEGESARARARAQALLLLHEQPDLSYTEAANVLSQRLGRPVKPHEVTHAHYTLEFTNSVDAVCHGRLYASRKLYEASLGDGRRAASAQAGGADDAARAVKVVSQLTRVAVRNNLAFKLDTKLNRVVISLAPGDLRIPAGLTEADLTTEPASVNVVDTSDAE